jgi:hypothetical protein
VHQYWKVLPVDFFVDKMKILDTMTNILCVVPYKICVKFNTYSENASESLRLVRRWEKKKEGGGGEREEEEEEERRSKKKKEKESVAAFFFLFNVKKH